VLLDLVEIPVDGLLAVVVLLVDLLLVERVVDLVDLMLVVETVHIKTVAQMELLEHQTLVVVEEVVLMEILRVMVGPDSVLSDIKTKY